MILFTEGNKGQGHDEWKGIYVQATQKGYIQVRASKVQK